MLLVPLGDGSLEGKGALWAEIAAAVAVVVGAAEIAARPGAASQTVLEGAKAGK